MSTINPIIRRVFMVCFLFLSHELICQSLEQNIRGRIVDKQTLQSLAGVSVRISPHQQVVFSDSLGRFNFARTPIGRYKVSFSRLGYAPYEIPMLEVTSGKEIVLPIEMEEKVVYLREVKIVAEKRKDQALNESALISTRQFSTAEANRYAGGFQDPARMALNFAGVSNAGSDQNNEIIIRGNSPKGLLWRMEGIEIPNPNHFGDGQGSTSGIISMINSTSLANSDFMTSAFPAEYGNASSGVFDLRFRRGNNEKLEWMAQLSVVGIDLALEGPLGKQGGSYRVGARYSTLELLLKSGLVRINTGNFKPAYRDFNYTIEVPLKKAGTLSFWGLLGSNDTEDEKIKSREYSSGFMGVFGVGHKLPMKYGNLSSNLAFTQESTQFDRDEILNSQWKNIRNQSYRYPNWRLNSTYLHKVSSATTLKLGFVLSRLGFDLQENRWNGRALVNYLQESDATYYSQVFTQVTQKWTPFLQSTIGLHAYHFSLNGAKALEPRMAISFQNQTGGRFGLGIGWHSRLEPLSIYLYKRYPSPGIFVQPNKSIIPSRSMHQVLSFDQLLGESTRLKIEAYWQDIQQVPIDSARNGVFSMVNYSSGIPSQVLVNEGRGINKGLEFTLERFFANDFYYLLTASLFDSKYQNRNLIWRNTQFNNLFAANLLVGKDFQLNKQKTLSINFRYMLRGGNRYTPINLPESIKRNTTILQSAKINEAQYPNFNRLDFSLAYKINRKGHTWSIRADVQNSLNTSNVIEERYDSALKALTYRYALPMVPILSTRLDF
ncbi:carboxypeptidase regulatory-like domain-containing protein [Aquirufa sp.]|uniref:TonB-dependent receptor n=1 Tax=Aquirufa sp. TaxID=2676249 RepID=UPI0037BEB0D7